MGLPAPRRYIAPPTMEFRDTNKKPFLFGQVIGNYYLCADMSSTDQHLQQAISHLREFLTANKLRCTRERIAILEAIYESDEPFTIEDLIEKMKERRFYVSTATLYATAELLGRANLVLRHPASFASTLYEKVPEERTSCIMICNSCHKVKHIDKKEVLAAIDEIPTKRFNPSHRITYIYGLCTSCKAKQQRVLRQVRNAKNIHKDNNETR